MADYFGKVSFFTIQTALKCLWHDRARLKAINQMETLSSDDLSHLKSIESAIKELEPNEK